MQSDNAASYEQFDATKCDVKKRKILLFDSECKINNNTTILPYKGFDSTFISKSVKHKLVKGDLSKKYCHPNKRSLSRNGESETTTYSSFKDSSHNYDKVKRSATFPHIIHDMVTHTARTKPHIIDWIEDGEAFLIHDTVS